MENEMSNHDWNDASVTPCPTGVPVQITYLHPYLSGYHTAEGEVLAAGRCILTPDRNTVALASIVSWRHRPEPEIPTMVPSKLFPGRWWWDGVLDLPTGNVMCYLCPDGTHGYTFMDYRTGDVTRCPGYPTVAEAMQAAEQYIMDTVGELT
jgi:hypothetical protein